MGELRPLRPVPVELASMCSGCGRRNDSTHCGQCHNSTDSCVCASPADDPFAIATVRLPLGGMFTLNRVAIVRGQIRAHITLDAAGKAHAWVTTNDLVALHTAAAKELQRLVDEVEGFTPGDGT